MSAYDDLDSLSVMHDDAAEIAVRLPRSVPRPAYGAGYADWYAAFPSDRPKPEIVVDEAAQRIAAAVGLELG